MAHLQESKIERVRDASGSDGDRIDVADCDPFPTGELDLEAFGGGVEVVADERPDVGSNRAAAASAGDSALVSGVLTGGEG